MHALSILVLWHTVVIDYPEKPSNLFPWFGSLLWFDCFSLVAGCIVLFLCGLIRFGAAEVFLLGAIGASVICFRLNCYCSAALAELGIEAVPCSAMLHEVYTAPTTKLGINDAHYCVVLTGLGQCSRGNYWEGGCSKVAVSDSILQRQRMLLKKKRFAKMGREGIEKSVL